MEAPGSPGPRVWRKPQVVVEAPGSWWRPRWRNV
ncbi:hypothetical protein Hamer_G008612 [Homarus americanus]|uniref:Uncharacterized protein n=1 Tax=Homarus americanus TaxID=6706 RepID=A0A8J5N4Z1_HOMAM|nr:hypothetical protein Hamer_G008612 [Homarus americanus]